MHQTTVCLPYEFGAPENDIRSCDTGNNAVESKPPCKIDEDQTEENCTGGENVCKEVLSISFKKQLTLCVCRLGAA